MRTRLPTLALLSALCVAGSGCRDREVTSYRVPKEKDAPAAASAPPVPANPVASGPAAPTPAAPAAGPATMANTAVPTAAGDLGWTAPAHWQSKPASAMRKATYAIPVEGGTAGELAITAFPGDVGGETANINRWRGQIQLPPASAADLAGVTRFEANGLKFAVVDYDNGQQRLLGAIVPVKGSTWFFKLTGPAAPMAKEKDAFLGFLKTVKAP